jgi:hypothetical protein
LVVGVDDARALSADGALTCAQRRDDTVLCWGGLTQAHFFGPMAPPLPAGAKEVRVVGDRLCALKPNQSVSCFDLE